MNPFLSLRDYEEFVYTLQHSYPIIKGSSLVVIQRGKYIAVLQGDLIFAHGYRISIKERLSDDSFVKIEDYGYEFWYHSEKIAWYDSQPHPGDPTLASTHPHHKHAPPNIKHNRIPAKNMRFTQPNLPALIQDVEDLINQLINESQPKE